ncbi:MAG: MFS transporter [Eggerthellaceae bacterium]|nr:MFS transporter [Eggerthellaceae bacterium]
MEKKLASNKILWIFAIGQLGWASLSGVISNCLVYYYMPEDTLLSQGHTIFIAQTAVFLGVLTVIGIITALGRLFDAVTDPWIASLSDRCKHRLGRRIPFMRYAAIPFGVITVLVFWSPINGESVINSLFLGVMMLLFYLAMTCYCTPYNALIPELGRTQKLRINVSTYISATYFIGTALAYTVPTIASALFPTFGVAGGFRIAVGILVVIAVVCMLIPAFAIDEHKYADTTPSESPAFSSLMKTFKNKEFQTFVASDILYWIAFTMFQTGLLYYVTELMGLSVAWSTILLVLMMVVAFVLYIPVNFLAKRVGKKKLIVFAFSFFAATFAITALSGMVGVPFEAWGILIAILASIPLAILGVLPQAVVADIADVDAADTGEARQGMFYAARTFAMKLGQAVSMLVFTGIIAMDIGDAKYRITAIVACAFCLLGAIVFARYHEKKVLARIDEELAQEGLLENAGA